MYNAGDRKDVRRAEKAARLAERARIEFLQSSMGTIQGRAWFLHILTSCHIFSDPFTGDALREAYSKGERNVGLGIYSDLVTHCPDQFILMMREETERNENARRTAERSSGSLSDGGDSESSLDPYADPDGA